MTDPQIWSGLAEALRDVKALRCRQGERFGIGLSFAGVGGAFLCLDLDGDFAGGEPSERLLWLMRHYRSWGERSVSGDGAHLFYRGRAEGKEIPVWRGSGIEIFGGVGFVALTGEGLDASALELADGTEVLRVLHAETREKPPHTPSANGKPHRRLLVDRWLADRGVAFRVKPRPDAKGRTVYVLKECPFNAEHGDPDSCVMQASDGTLSAQCFHTSCGGKGWTEFRDQIGKPEGHHWDPPYGQETTTMVGSSSAWEIIRDYFRQRYGDGFRTGDAIYCNAERREVRRQEATAALPPELIGPLGNAENAPMFPNGTVKVEGLPGFFKKWAGTAWAAFIATLPDEDGASTGAVEIAADEFRRLVRQALLSEFTLARTVKDERGNREQRQEHRSAISWCETFAKPGGWRTVRSKKLWSRYVDMGDGEVKLQVALRHEFFSQIKADRRLIEMGSNTFTRRARRYGVGEPGGQADRPGGQWALILADGFVADLTDELPFETESCTPCESATTPTA